MVREAPGGFRRDGTLTRFGMPGSTAFIFVAFLVVQLIAFFAFYRHPYGRRAVYDAWYAWIIDVLAIVSGTVIMFVSVYALYNPWIFTIPIPDITFFATFIVGSWQACIHAVKWFIRSFGH